MATGPEKSPRRPRANHTEPIRHRRNESDVGDIEQLACRSHWKPSSSSTGSIFIGAIAGDETGRRRQRCLIRLASAPRERFANGPSNLTGLVYAASAIAQRSARFARCLPISGPSTFFRHGHTSARLALRIRVASTSNGASADLLTDTPLFGTLEAPARPVVTFL
jgi:hypothetical protein